MTETLKWQMFFILILVAIAGYFAYPSEHKPFFEEGDMFYGRKIQLGLDLQGGSEIIVALKHTGLSPEQIREGTEQAKDIINQRINRYGVKEARIQRYGRNQIQIQLPGLDQAEVNRVKKIIVTSGKLEFKLEREPVVVKRYEDRYPLAPEGSRWYVREAQPGQSEVKVLVKEESVLSGKHIVEAGTEFDPSHGLAITFELDQIGAALFAKVTSKHAEEKTGEERALAIILDDKLVSAPNIQTPITEGKGRITGSFTAEQAQDLAIVLRSGKLPAPLEIQSESFVGPSLGEDSIRRGMISFVLAIIAVVLFMSIYYLGAGLVANIAMLMNVILILGIMSLFSATLTLPGIAGLVLTMGMAVDSNILFYERIREEKKKGKPLKNAFESGFDTAFVTVLDANLTTLIAGLILYYFGTGPIKGFAVTLSIGILTTLFTGYFVTRCMLRLCLAGGLIKKFSMLQFFSRPNINFMKYARLSIISVILIIIGLCIFFTKGKSSYGIDFTGGTVLNINFREPTDIRTVREAIQDITVTDAETGVTNLKYPDAEVQSVMPPIKNTAGIELGELFSKAGAVAEEFQIRTRFAKTEEDVAALKNELKEMFSGGLVEYPIAITSTQKQDYPLMMLVRLPAPLELDTVSERLKARMLQEGFSEPKVLLPRDKESVTESIQYEVFFKENKPTDLDKILREEFNLSEGPFPRIESIGSAVAHDLQKKAVIALILSWLAMILYLAVRFEFKYGLASVAALIHDVLISLGMVVAFNWLAPESWGIKIDLNLVSIAAFLAIIGYSVNDTVVVFDRIRENLKEMKRASLRDVINLSINQTLSRTIITSLTLFLTVTILFGITAWSGGGIASFAFPMIIGTIAGTYSTIFIASPILNWGRREEKKSVGLRA